MNSKCAFRMLLLPRVIITVTIVASDRKIYHNCVCQNVQHPWQSQDVKFYKQIVYTIASDNCHWKLMVCSCELDILREF